MNDLRAQARRQPGGRDAVRPFLRNPAVTSNEMLRNAGQATGTRGGGRRVLVIQDTMELNFSTHKGGKRGFGTVGNGIDIGLFLHPQVVVDAVTGGLV